MHSPADRGSEDGSLLSTITCDGDELAEDDVLYFATAIIHNGFGAMTTVPVASDGTIREG